MNNPTLYNLELKDLNLNRKNIFKYLGYPGDNIPDPYPDILEEMLVVAEQKSSIQAGFVLFDNISISKKKRQISLNGIDFDTGIIITSAMDDIKSAVLFVGTAGPEIENYSKQLMKEGQLVEGYIMDVIGSEVVETALDYCQDIIESELKNKGLNITNRYSPGYCGWHVSEQHKLFSLLPENFCNIKLKESALMIPIKSVSGIIGIGKDIIKQDYACDICDQENCVYRKGSF
jgi:hypothetical protein